MGTFVIKDRPTWLGSYDMADYATALAVDYGAEAVDDTVLSDSTRSMAGGLKTLVFRWMPFLIIAVQTVICFQILPVQFL